MRISVISPHVNNNGNTTLAMLIALEISNNGRNTCITHVKPLSNSFYEYLNFVGYQDKTSTPSQIVKIIKEGELLDDDVTDYCKRINNNLEAFTNDTTNFSQGDMDFMIDYIARSFPHEHIVFDVDDNDLEQVRRAVDNSDVVVLNITQSISELKQFHKNKDKYIDIIESRPLVVVVNKYNSVKGTLKETANWIGVKRTNNWLVLRDNPWIAWATNHGQLLQLYKKIKTRDARVIELNPDLEKIYKNLVRAKVAKDRRFGGRGR